MNRNEFRKAVEEEGLSHLGTEFDLARMLPSRNWAGGWIVTQTGERGELYVISLHASEEEGLDALLGEMRNRKEYNRILEKIRSGN